jgi:hypothetical protein
MPYGRQPAPPIPLGKFANNQDPDWGWFYCDTITCVHRVAIRYKTLVERHGPDMRWDHLLARMKCTVCGHRGATWRHPSWRDTETGWQPFPGDE